MAEDSLSNLRLAEYKSRSVICDQEVRRSRLLEEQKKRRASALNAARELPEDIEANHKQIIEAPYTQLSNMIMLSEWMNTVPADLTDNWIFVLCPTGKRTLLYASKGITTAYSRHGYRKCKFKSSLPGGNPSQKQDVSILDCIWVDSSKTYYVLDIICWKKLYYVDHDTNFRRYWMTCKFSEDVPDIGVTSRTNSFPIKLLDYHPCDVLTLSRVLSEYPAFPNNKPSIDGILFFHSEALYTGGPGTTPMVLWLKTFMVPDRLGVSVATEYWESRPEGYTDADSFIMWYDERERKNRSRRKNKKQNDNVNMSEGEEEMTVEDELPLG